MKTIPKPFASDNTVNCPFNGTLDNNRKYLKTPLRPISWFSRNSKRNRIKIDSFLFRFSGLRFIICWDKETAALAFLTWWFHSTGAKFLIDISRPNTLLIFWDYYFYGLNVTTIYNLFLSDCYLWKVVVLGFWLTFRQSYICGSRICFMVNSSLNWCVWFFLS